MAVSYLETDGTESVNLDFGRLPIQQSSGISMAELMASQPEKEPSVAGSEALFGTHLREAVRVVRDWLKNP